MTEKIGVSLVKESKSEKKLKTGNFIKINIQKENPKIEVKKIPKPVIINKVPKEQIIEEKLPIRVAKPIILKKQIQNTNYFEEKLPVKIAKPIVLKRKPIPKKDIIKSNIDRKNSINLSRNNTKLIAKHNLNLEEIYKSTSKRNILRSNMNKKRELLKKVEQPKSLDLKSKITTNNSKINIYLVLILISFIFVIISPIFFVNSNWIFSWEIIKTVVFGVGIFLISIFFLLLWAIGNIDYQKKFTAYDATILLFGIGLIILTILNKDISLVWGNVQRPFDSGIIYLALILLYFILRFFVNLNFVKFVLNIWSILIIVSVTPLILVSSFDIQPIDLLQKLFPSYTFLSSSIIQIAILTILSIISLWYISYGQKGISLIFNNFILLLGVFYYILLLQIIQNQTLLIVSIAMAMILFLVDLKENNITKNKFSFKYIIWSISLVIGIFTSIFVKSNSLTQEFYLNFSQGLNYTRQSLGDSLLYGKGVSYTWNKFLPNDFLQTSVWDTDLFNFWSEIFNFIVRVGSFGLIFILIILLLIGLDFLASIIQTKFINKEQSLVLVLFILLLFFPMELIAKIGVILLIVLYLGKENFNFPMNLWQGKTGLKNYNSQIVSVIGILSFGLIFLNFIVVSNFIKAFQAHNLYELAIASTDESINLEKITESKNKFTNYSLYFEYYIQQETKLLDKKLTEIIQNQDENNTEQISELNQKIKSLLDEIAIQKIRYPYSLNIINSEIDLKFLIKRYGSINDEDILENINLAENLKPNSPKWDFYRAKLYILSYQTNSNPEFIDKAIEYIEKSLNKNTTYVLGYELYADIYAILKDNPNQIKVLEKYIEIVQKNKKVADVKLIYRLANLYYQEKEYQLSEQLLNVLIRDLPESIDSYVLLGDVYIAQGETEKAKFVFEKALEKQPDLEIAKEKLKNL